MVAAWNGLAIAALAETGLLLGEPAFVDGARRAAELLARVHFSAGRLARTSRDGVASGSAGVLEDYACVAEGLLTLSGVTGEARWLSLAGELLDTALERFGDGSGGFYDTADDGEALVYRPADPADGPTPSGAFAVAGALLSYSALTGSMRHRDAAVAGLGLLPADRGAVPARRRVGPGRRRGADLRARRDRGRRPGGRPAHGRAARDRAARRPAGRGHRARGRGGAGRDTLLEGRGLVGGAPAAYVCRGFACLAPVTEPEALRAALSGAAPAG